MFLRTLTLLFIVVFGVGSAAQAQDIEAMLEKLKRIEEQIKTLQGEPQTTNQTPTLQDISQDVIFIRSEFEKQTTANILAGDLKNIIQDIETRIQTLPAPKEEPPTLAISGFGDALRVLRQGDEFTLGQVEVDLEATVDNVVVATAIAYDGAAFSLGAFEVILPIWGNEKGHFKSVQEIVTSELSVGQFDVPFGLDLHVYPSIDRKLVTAPLIVEQTHGGWNDFGIRGHLETDYFKIDLFGTNGFGYETIDAGNNPIELASKFALGGRLGIMPVSGFELGSSVAGIWDENDDLGMVMIGFDAQLEYQRLATKGEYIWHQTGRASSKKTSHKGLYGQALLTLSPVFLVGRYDRFWPESDAEASRLSTGIGYIIVDGCEVRFEYQFNFDNAPDVGFTQIVVGF